MQVFIFLISFVCFFLGSSSTILGYDQCVGEDYDCSCSWYELYQGSNCTYKCRTYWYPPAGERICTNYDWECCDTCVRWNYPCDPDGSDHPNAYKCLEDGVDDGLCVSLNSSEGCGEVCGGSSSACCDGSQKSWTKYNVQCVLNSYYLIGLYAYESVSDVCSIGDKCLQVTHQSDGGNTGSSLKETALRTSNCSTCGYGKQYKVCCSNTPFSGPVECFQYSADGRDPPEGGCPSGSTIVRREAWVGSSVGCSGNDFKSADGNCYDAWLDGSVLAPELVEQMCPSTPPNNPPTVSSIIVRNSSGTEIGIDSGIERNHICQSYFSDDKIVSFEVTLNDNQGFGDIDLSSIQLRLDSSLYGPPQVVSSSGNDLVVRFDFTPASTVPTGLNVIEVNASDSYGESTGWVNDNSRSFKFWDCEVPVIGGIYDNSDQDPCLTFNGSLSTSANLSSLTFTSSSPVLSSIMTVPRGGIDNTYEDGGNELIWGTLGYLPSFNLDLAVDTGNLDTRLIDSDGSKVCVSGSFDINNNNTVDPYVSNPSLTADFLAVVDQDAWFQSYNGGILSRTKITNYVPVTYSPLDHNSAMSINGLVAAPTFDTTIDIDYGDPNWFVSSNLVLAVNFYEKYSSLGIGEEIGGGDIDLNSLEGLVLVDGDVNIISDNALLSGEFLMVVASGDITIDPSVTSIDGIFVGNNINILGTNSSQLNINGSLYGLSQVNISRGYSDKSDNNDAPAVKVNLRPDLLFNIPNEVNQGITSWKWGN